MARLHFIDFAIIVLVLGVTVFLGFRFSRKQNSTQNFFLSKGNIPSWALGLSLLATLISSVTFLGYPAQGYTGNWILLVQGLMVPVVLLGCIWFIVPLFRKSIGLSTYEYFEKRFGSFARYYSSLSFVVRQFAGMGTVLFLIAVAIREMIHVNPFMVLAVVALLLIIVNLKGGIQAVIWLDVFQGFMLFFSGIVCLVVLLNSIKGGVPEAIRIATENQRAGFGPYDFSFKHLTFIVMVVNGAFYAVQKYATDQTVVQRYLTAKSDRDAIRASFLGISLTVPIWTLFMLIGTALFVYYKQQGAPEGMKAEGIFPHFIMTQLPPGIIGFIIAALLSAAICSLSADLNSLAAVGVEDYYKKIVPGKGDQHYLQVSKLLVMCSGLLAAGIGALYILSGDEGVLGIIFTVYAIFSGGIVGVFLLGLFSSRANRQGVNIAIVVCIIFTAYAFLTSTPVGLKNPKLLLDLGPFNFTHNKLMLGVYSHLVVIIVGYIASLFFPKPAIEPNLLYSNWKKNRKTVNRV
ncbi:sodium:solute symporter [Niabella soli]|uniref:Sodium transporter n=1 Tax=Niabella soli DSM 19437 TaxID=929713 RepID=W0EXP6_9BACT|nr:sodium:solute symporter [Niabella soli]AHF14328.1 sodium transporter [Niabella soli DSM 19437]